MNPITDTNWSFEKIRAVDDTRAARLESCGPPEDLLASLEDALDQAIDGGGLRTAVDSKNNAFIERRTIMQFRLSPHLYDWYFNARTGYRAQYWIGPEAGTAFNKQIAKVLAEVLTHHLPTTVTVRKIDVNVEGDSREENDVGAMEISRDEFLASLAPDASKIWIGERLYSPEGGKVTQIGVATLLDAARSEAKLCVPRWADAINPKSGCKGEGLRAPCPDHQYSWLDLKGGFLDFDGNPGQIKPQDQWAKEIYECGWT